MSEEGKTSLADMKSELLKSAAEHESGGPGIMTDAQPADPGAAAPVDDKNPDSQKPADNKQAPSEGQPDGKPAAAATPKIDDKKDAKSPDDVPENDDDLAGAQMSDYQKRMEKARRAGARAAKRHEKLNQREAEIQHREEALKQKDAAPKDDGKPAAKAKGKYTAQELDEIAGAFDKEAEKLGKDTDAGKEQLRLAQLARNDAKEMRQSAQTEYHTFFSSEITRNTDAAKKDFPDYANADSPLSKNANAAFDKVKEALTPLNMPVPPVMHYWIVEHENLRLKADSAAGLQKKVDELTKENERLQQSRRIDGSAPGSPGAAPEFKSKSVSDMKTDILRQAREADMAHRS
ncbi:MAG TPA: hypothetical protein VGN17_05155 [Bryobacteraceae bacterium]|jgi:hypothetical protein